MKTNSHFAACPAVLLRHAASFLLILGILFAGCRENKPENPAPDPAGTVTVTGDAKVGETLTASSDGTLTGAFTWESSATRTSENWDPVSGATGDNSENLTLTSAHKGLYIRAKRGTAASEAASEPTSKVVDSTPAPDPTPTPNTVTIKGDLVVNQTITAESSDATATGDFAWASASSATAADSEWKLISTGVGGTNKSELTLDASLKDQYIRATRGTTPSAAFGPVKDATTTTPPGNTTTPGSDTGSNTGTGTGTTTTPGGDDVTPGVADLYDAAGLNKVD